MTSRLRSERLGPIEIAELRRDMTEQKWKARTKRDLMIEVWEALDCESVGAAELLAIEEAVRVRFGDGAVESHASVARLLADEGAELRHPEVLELDVLQRTSDPYGDTFRGVLEIADLDAAANSIRRLEEFRKTFTLASDQIGLRRVRQIAMKGRRDAQVIAGNRTVDEKTRNEKAEIAEWFGVWLKQPEIFETWLELRRDTLEFRERFGV